MNAALPDEEAYRILTDEKQNGHLVLLDAKAVTVESMVWNGLSLALNAEGIHVATCLHAKIRTLIQTNS